MARPGYADMLVLASGSPRRRQLLEELGLAFVQRPANCDEQSDTRDPAELVRELARRKALACPLAAGETAVAADTVVCLNGEILGKPHSPERAAEMLRALSGRTHEVHTGVALRRASGEPQVFSECTRVTFRTLSDGMIARYVASGEPFDKAGGYGIQGAAAVFVESIEGDYFNVMGLPVCALWKHLQLLGEVDV